MDDLFGCRRHEDTCSSPAYLRMRGIWNKFWPAPSSLTPAAFAIEAICQFVLCHEFILVDW